MFGKKFLGPDFLAQCQIVTNDFQILFRCSRHGNVQPIAIVQQNLGDEFSVQVKPFQATLFIVLDIKQHLHATAKFLKDVDAAHGTGWDQFRITGQIWRALFKRLQQLPVGEYDLS